MERANMIVKVHTTMNRMIMSVWVEIRRVIRGTIFQDKRLTTHYDQGNNKLVLLGDIGEGFNWLSM